MIKRYIQRRQSKCNFCFEWFFSESTIKSAINLCNPCIEKALNTYCYRVHSPDGKQFYQLFLFRNNVRITHDADGQDHQTDRFKISLIESIDEYRNEEIKKMADKWEGVSQEIGKMKQLDEQQCKNISQVLKTCVKQHPTAADLMQKITNTTAQTPLAKTRQKTQQENPTDIYFSGSNIKSKQSNLIRNSCKIKQGEVSLLNPSMSMNSPSRNPLSEIMNTPNGKVQPLDFEKSISGVKAKYHNKSKFAIELFAEDDCKMKRNPSQDNFATKSRHDASIMQRQKQEKLLQTISQDSLKSRIYSYLQNTSTVPQALYLPMTLKIYDALQNTSSLNKCIQLISHKMDDLDIKCYLNMLDWTNIEVLKLVKVRLDDQQFKDVLIFLQDKRVETLVVTSNLLTQAAVQCFGALAQQCRSFRNLYLGRNRIQKNKVKDTLKQLESKFVLYI